MDRQTMLDRLDKATDRVAMVAVRRKSILPEPRKLVSVGTDFVQKSSLGFYNVLSSTKEIMYRDICVFDVAIIIAQKHSTGQRKALRDILKLESSFFKYHTDMTHYLNCMRKAKARRDVERLCILEDKFRLAEVHAKDLRDKLSSFKRVK